MFYFIGHLAHYFELTKGAKNCNCRELLKAIFNKSDYLKTLKELINLPKKLHRPVLVLDNIHYLNENKGIFTDLLSIFKVFYDRGLTIIFLSSSLDVRETMK